jgi:hypothetical protein
MSFLPLCRGARWNTWGARSIVSKQGFSPQRHRDTEESLGIRAGDLAACVPVRIPREIPSAAVRPQPNKRDEPRRGRSSAFATPNVSGLARSASKQVFNTEKPGGRTRPRRDKIFAASYGVRSNTARSAILVFSVVLSGSPWFSVLKTCLLWDRHPRPVVDGSRLADAKTYASCNRPALRAVLAEAPTNQCVIDIAAEIRRRPR